MRVILRYIFQEGNIQCSDSPSMKSFIMPGMVMEAAKELTKNDILVYAVKNQFKQQISTPFVSHSERQFTPP